MFNFRTEEEYDRQYYSEENIAYRKSHPPTDIAGIRQMDYGSTPPPKEGQINAEVTEKKNCGCGVENLPHST